jgi:membrane associated rhomboid family serine protease
MFPIADSIKTRRFPFVNTFFIILCVYIFIQELVAPDTEVFIQHYALIPSHVDFGNFATIAPFMTAIFLHGGFLHILSNMWFLFIFGDNVEDALPLPTYLLLFLGAGVIGNLVQYLFMPLSTVPMLGASGAVAGILGCYYVLFPYAKVKTLIFILFFVTLVNVSAPVILGYWFILQLFSGAGSLQTMQTGTQGVAFFAHITGFVIGLIVGRMYKKELSSE